MNLSKCAYFESPSMKEPTDKRYLLSIEIVIYRVTQPSHGNDGFQNLQKCKCILFWENINRHYQRHNGPKALSALTQSTPLIQSRSFNIFLNLGQTSACFFRQFCQIHISTLANPYSNFDKSTPGSHQSSLNNKKRTE